jgi:hypothetical protein
MTVTLSTAGLRHSDVTTLIVATSEPNFVTEANNVRGLPLKMSGSDLSLLPTLLIELIVTADVPQAGTDNTVLVNGGFTKNSYRCTPDTTIE